MPPIHPDASRFLCSRCYTPTRCNDLIASDGPDRDFCADCLHIETIREIYATHDPITDHNRRGKGPALNLHIVEDSEFEW